MVCSTLSGSVTTLLVRRTWHKSIETADVSVRSDARIEHICRRSPNHRRQTIPWKCRLQHTRPFRTAHDQSDFL